MDLPRERYSSPEEAAISSYPPAASARVVRVEPLDDRHVDVIVDTNPSHLMRVHCEMEGGTWYVTGDIVE
jgi:hypothetical protein